MRRRYDQDLTYDDLHSIRSIDNLWSVLFTTGYLTQRQEGQESAEEFIKLMIPNKEVREVFIESDSDRLV